MPMSDTRQIPRQTYVASLFFLFVDYVQGHKLSARFMHPDTKKMASSGFSSIETSAQTAFLSLKITVGLYINSLIAIILNLINRSVFARSRQRRLL